jgi:sugar (pentulose or hexulose) kinase
VLERGRAIVVDIGKTHAKVSLWSRDGLCLEKQSRANLPQANGRYPTLDTAATAEWLIDCLKSFADHPVEAIVPVAHGAAIAGIRDAVLAFPPPDYEWDIPPATLADYRAQRDSFATTGSPALPRGLNIGAQLHAIEAESSLDGITLLPYAQYWAWLLCGVAVSEVTSLGCHSDLWQPEAADFSPLARQRGWAERFAPLAQAGDVIGTLRPELAAQTGLSAQVRIHAGLHDSNAALLSARGFLEIAGQESTVLSTGTWFIAMRTSAEPVSLASLPEHRDCLVNVDVNGKPVPSARFMGGRELELLGERIDCPGTEGLADVLIDHAMLLPSQISGSGPFPGSFGRWINQPEDPTSRRAAAALYAALMADTALDLIGAQDCLLIEGRFARSELFTRALATLRPETQVWTTSAEADVSFGALRLIWPDLTPLTGLEPVAPLDRSLAAYRAEWHDDIAAFA